MNNISGWKLNDLIQKFVTETLHSDCRKEGKRLSKVMVSVRYYPRPHPMLNCGDANDELDLWDVILSQYIVAHSPLVGLVSYPKSLWTIYLTSNIYHFYFLVTNMLQGMDIFQKEGPGSWTMICTLGEKMNFKCKIWTTSNNIMTDTLNHLPQTQCHTTLIMTTSGSPISCWQSTTLSNLFSVCY